MEVAENVLKILTQYVGSTGDDVLIKVCNFSLFTDTAYFD